MTVAGIGVDIVEIERVRRIIERTPRFRERVFTPAERKYAQKRAHPWASYAGMWAAREAVLKALGIGFGKGVRYDDVTVTHDAKGRPQVELHGEAAAEARRQGVRDVFVSISHTHEMAVANAVLGTDKTRPAKAAKVDERAQVAARFKEARALLGDITRKQEGE